MTRRLWISGGTGWLGSALVRLARMELWEVDFTWHTHKQRALELEALGAHGHCCDVRQPGAVEDFINVVDPCDAFVHAAFSRGDTAPMDAWSINVEAAVRFVECRASHSKPFSVVFPCGIAAQRAVETTPWIAASHGAIAALTRQLSRCYGAKGIRVNAAMFADLNGGLTDSLPEAQARDLIKFSALARRGTVEEAARAVLWLASEAPLDGAVVPWTAGI